MLHQQAGWGKIDNNAIKERPSVPETTTARPASRPAWLIDSADFWRLWFVGLVVFTVRWVETVQAIRARGISHIVECGPGKVLAGMVRRLDAEAHGLAMFDPATLSDVRGALA